MTRTPLLRLTVAALVGSCACFAIHQALAYDSYGVSEEFAHTSNQPYPALPRPIGDGYFGAGVAPASPGNPQADMLTYLSDYTTSADATRRIGTTAFRSVLYPHLGDPSFGPPNYLYLNPDRTSPMYQFAYTRGARGNEPDSGAVSNFYSCPSSDVADGAPLDLTQCRLMTPDEELSPTDKAWESPFGWVSVRRKWNEPATGNAGVLGHGPEHMLIVQAAAQYAGLANNPLFTQVFWVRYPIKDAYVASPYGEGSKAQVAVAQSWRPARMRDVTAHVERPIFLPELAQLPDASNSVWDWLAGDEECPTSILDAITKNKVNIFKGDPSAAINACHQFKLVMGAINASHFLPAAQGFYAHYHQLALSRMDECNLLAPIATAFQQPAPNQWPTYGDAVANWVDPIPFDAEVHECEREAFVYEMFAQHFLQDAWSSGHMWFRWGSPELSSFPALLGPWPRKSDYAPSKDDLVMATANEAARRYSIAGVTAAFAGTIHGAKAIVSDIEDEWTSYLGSSASSKLIWWLNWNAKFVDDPLCGPHYYNPFDLSAPYTVTWTRDGVVPEFGLGDLYWNSSTASLSTNADYDEQRQSLLACSAKSLIEVYGRGPQAHGAMGPVTAVQPLSGGDAPRNPNSVDIMTECFNQRATNTSILGAGTPFLIRRRWSGSEAKLTAGAWDTVLDVVNKIVQGQVVGKVTFADTVDQGHFVDVLGQRVQADLQQSELQMYVNALAYKNGTQSAELQSPWPATPPAADAGAPDGATGDGGPTAPDGGAPPGRITFLSVPPNSTVPSYPAGVPVSYADTPAPPIDDGSKATYPARVFWRSHMRETCQDTQAVALLRDRCIAAAAFGGDPDSCTACMNIAELHIPRCDLTGTLQQSKCQSLGAEGDMAPLPSYWFDPNGCHCAVGQSGPIDDPTCGWAVSRMARDYCSGTSAYDGGSGGVLFLSTNGTSPEVDTWRVAAREQVRSLNFPAPQDLSPRLVPMMSAYQEQITWTPVSSGSSGPNAGGAVPISSRDVVLQQMLRGLPIWDSQSDGYLALVQTPEDVAVPSCGQMQRWTFWNQSCDQVLNGWGALNVELELPADGADGGVVNDGVPDDPTGSYFKTHSGPSVTLDTTTAQLANGAPAPRCSVREVRTLVSTCPGGATCGSGGACVFARTNSSGVTGTSPAPAVTVLTSPL